MWRPTGPSAQALLSRRLQRLTCPRQRPFVPGRRARYPASYTRTSGGDAGPTVLAFLLPFGHRRSLLGHPVPAPEFSPPYGRPTTLVGVDPDRVSMFRTHETRLG